MWSLGISQWYCRPHYQQYPYFIILPISLDLLQHWPTYTLAWIWHGNALWHTDYGPEIQDGQFCCDQFIKNMSNLSLNQSRYLFKNVKKWFSFCIYIFHDYDTSRCSYITLDSSYMCCSFTLHRKYWHIWCCNKIMTPTTWVEKWNYGSWPARLMFLSCQHHFWTSMLFKTVGVTLKKVYLEARQRNTKKSLNTA